MSIQQYRFDPNEFSRLRKYYYSVLNLRNVNISNEEDVDTSYCSDDMFFARSKAPWTLNIDKMSECCTKSNFSTSLYHDLYQRHDGNIVASLFIFCKVYLYYIRNR